ncbi:MAG: sensor histidine kinase [Bacteroidota bacterium]|jgi:two-component system LytT family sensor kinase
MAGFSGTSKFSNVTDVAIRHSIIAVLTFAFVSLNVAKGDFEWFDLGWWQMYSYTFLQIACIWNGNVLMVDKINQHMPWHGNIRSKLFLSLFIALLWPVIIYYSFSLYIYPLIFGEPCNLSSSENVSYLATTVIITLLVNAVFSAIEFFQFWRQSVKEAEELKLESLSAEFETLKNQINPHFLFNSLNTLTSLIEEQPSQATEFVQKLSNVYRYVLTQKDKQLVSLREELEFIQSYVYLNQIRFGDNLKVIIDIPDEYLSRSVVTLSLQMLIENCIKHNTISVQKPLVIKVMIQDKKLVVSNNLQHKNVMHDSNGIGLNNIVHRYSFVSNEDVVITDDGTTFSVSLPLINTEKS